MCLQAHCLQISVSALLFRAGASVLSSPLKYCCASRNMTKISELLNDTNSSLVESPLPANEKYCHSERLAANSCSKVSTQTRLLIPSLCEFVRACNERSALSAFQAVNREREQRAPRTKLQCRRSKPGHSLTVSYRKTKRFM